MISFTTARSTGVAAPAGPAISVERARTSAAIANAPARSTSEHFRINHRHSRAHAGSDVLSAHAIVRFTVTTVAALRRLTRLRRPAVMSRSGSGVAPPQSRKIVVG